MDLEGYRGKIDRVNREIADAVSRRMNLVEEIGQYKRQNDMEVEDEGREEEIKQQFEKLFKDENLPQQKGRELAEFLINLAKEKQNSQID